MITTLRDYLTTHSDDPDAPIRTFGVLSSQVRAIEGARKQEQRGTFAR